VLIAIVHLCIERAKTTSSLYAFVEMALFSVGNSHAIQYNAGLRAFGTRHGSQAELLCDSQRACSPKRHDVGLIGVTQVGDNGVVAT
jgi:hypothetical protein